MAKKTNNKKAIIVNVKPRKKAATKAKKEVQELTRLGSALRTLGGLGGSMVGGLIGMGSEGKAAGTGIGAAISRWLGSGDYEVSKNSIVQSSLKSSDGVPMMHRTTNSVVVRHREFLTTISGSQTFAIAAEFALNPGLRGSFPWLSALAQGFQEYKFLGVVFHYVPTSGQYNPTSNALGSVMFQTVYRASDNSPSTKYELLNEYWSSEVVPYETLAHPIECKASETVLGARYVRDGAVTDDIMFYDYGRTIVATSGCPAGQPTLGDIYVTYEVELRKPKLAAALGRTAVTLEATNVTTSFLRPFVSTGVTPRFSSFAGPVSLFSGIDNTTTLALSSGNAGSYLVVLSFKGSALSFGSFSVTGTNISIMNNATEGNTVGTAFSGATRYAYSFGFNIVDPTISPQFTITWTSPAGSLTDVYMYVTGADSDCTRVL